jgi:putative DNA primase/helicase
LLHGVGANGKTIFLETVAGLLGDYAMRTPTETLLLKRTGAIPNDVARLRGTRFVYASETEEGKRLAEALVKDMTGGDKISARFLRAEWFEFLPEFKLWLGTNHKPQIRGTDNAIWDRICLIPFTVIIPKEERIPRRELLARFRQEFPGILRWAVEGCLEWQKNGLGTPEEVKAATAAYRSEMDLVGHFLADCCIEKPSTQVKVQDLHKAYKSWCDANGETPLGKLAFGTRLTERGFIQRKQTAGVRYWVGIGLLDSQ